MLQQLSCLLYKHKSSVSPVVKKVVSNDTVVSIRSTRWGKCGERCIGNGWARELLDQTSGCRARLSL